MGSRPHSLFMRSRPISAAVKCLSRCLPRCIPWRSAPPRLGLPSRTDLSLPVAAPLSRDSTSRVPGVRQTRNCGPQTETARSPNQQESPAAWSGAGSFSYRDTPAHVARLDPRCPASVKTPQAPRSAAPTRRHRRSQRLLCLAEQKVTRSLTRAPGKDEVGNYIEAEPAFCSSRVRKSGSVTPSSAGTEPRMCAIRTCGWHPNRRLVRCPSGRDGAVGVSGTMR